MAKNIISLAIVFCFCQMASAESLQLSCLQSGQLESIKRDNETLMFERQVSDLSGVGSLEDYLCGRINSCFERYPKGGQLTETIRQSIQILMGRFNDAKLTLGRSPADTREHQDAVESMNSLLKACENQAKAEEHSMRPTEEDSGPIKLEPKFGINKNLKET